MHVSVHAQSRGSLQTYANEDSKATSTSTTRCGEGGGVILRAPRCKLYFYVSFPGFRLKSDADCVTDKRTLIIGGIKYDWVGKREDM